MSSPSNVRTTQGSRRGQGNIKRSRGSPSLARVNGQPSSGQGNANPTRSRRTIPQRFIEDDMTPADGATSDSPLVRGTSSVPLPPTGRRQGSRIRSCRNSHERPGSSSATVDAEPGISSETADRESGSSDAGVTEDDLTPEERDIYGTQLLSNLGKHPSVYARAGLNPQAKGLTFRGAWKKAVELYRAANDQYQQLFVLAGFGEFFKIEPVELPQGYLIALTERWFAETNSLHLPCCEIGPTPVDWTMITGVRFGGQRIKLNPEYGKDKVRELLGVRGRRDIFSGNRINLTEIKPTEAEVMADPEDDEAMGRIFRRLFLYVIGSCFFGNNRSVIHREIVQFLEDIYAVGNYDWGAVTYAAFLTGLRRKVTGEIGSFTAFWQFLPFWAFEYLNISRPEQTEDDIFPRAMRWVFPENPCSDNSELTSTRCQLDYVDDESQVTWQPYLASEAYSSDDINIGIAINLAKSRIPFISLDTWEYYLGERFRRQFGLTGLVPFQPPEVMHGKSTAYPEDDSDMVIPAETLVQNESVEYASWFAKNSVGKIVDVTRLIGGTDIGRKVVGHWMARHRPDMILIPRSEVDEIRQALNTADAERKKLQEELRRVRRGSDS